jgi:hypothetical protein
MVPFMAFWWRGCPSWPSGGGGLLPVKIFWLPLSMWWLRREEFQQLEYKVGVKIPTWKGNYVTTTGRTTLVKSVLTLQSI